MYGFIFIHWLTMYTLNIIGIFRQLQIYVIKVIEVTKLS